MWGVNETMWETGQVMVLRCCRGVTNKKEKNKFDRNKQDKSMEGV